MQRMRSSAAWLRNASTLLWQLNLRSNHADDPTSRSSSSSIHARGTMWSSCLPRERVHVRTCSALHFRPFLSFLPLPLPSKFNLLIPRRRFAINSQRLSCGAIINRGNWFPNYPCLSSRERVDGFIGCETCILLDNNSVSFNKFFVRAINRDKSS